VRHQHEEVFFEVGAGATDGLHLVATDHLGQRTAQLGGAHRAGEGDQHLPAGLQVLDIAPGSPGEARRVEMAVVVMDEVADLHLSPQKGRGSPSRAVSPA
jgi:hypothetical protein